MTNIIKVQFFKGGTPAGKAYSYYTPEPVDVRDIVDIKINHPISVCWLILFYE